MYIDMLQDTRKTFIRLNVTMNAELARWLGSPIDQVAPGHSFDPSILECFPFLVSDLKEFCTYDEAVRDAPVMAATGAGEGAAGDMEGFTYCIITS